MLNNYIVSSIQNGKDMLWEHVEKLLDDENELGLKRTKLTYDHIHLTPQNKMRVYLAAQVIFLILF